MRSPSPPPSAARAAPPTGTVQFSIDGVASGLPVALLGGQATLSTSALTAGSHTIDAAYSGDPNFTLSSATTWTQVVNAAASATVITETLGANPSTFGDALTFTATVSGPGGTPTGTVQFSIDGVASGLPVALLGGQATLSTSALTAGAPHHRRRLQR